MTPPDGSRAAAGCDARGLAEHEQGQHGEHQTRGQKAAPRSARRHVRDECGQAEAADDERDHAETNANVVGARCQRSMTSTRLPSSVTSSPPVSAMISGSLGALMAGSLPIAPSAQTHRESVLRRVRVCSRTAETCAAITATNRYASTKCVSRSTKYRSALNGAIRAAAGSEHHDRTPRRRHHRPADERLRQHHRVQRGSDPTTRIRSKPPTVAAASARGG